MGTQAVVSVVDERGNTIIKAACGCNGRSAGELGEKVRDGRIETVHGLLLAALDVGFGCDRCRVVMDGERVLGNVSCIPLEYRERFPDPWFNPRWKRGTADYHVVIEKGSWLEVEMPERKVGNYVSLPRGARI